MSNVILFAHPKTGQHWLIWLVSNYGKNKSSEWAEILEFSKFHPVSCYVMADEITYCSQKYRPNVKFARIEYPYDWKITKVHLSSPFIDSFDKRVYMYRNPADVLISMYYYFQTDLSKIKEVNEAKDFKSDPLFDLWAKEKLYVYLDHVERSVDHCDLLLCYDDLLVDPTPLKTFLSFIYGKVMDKHFKKALEMSKASTVKKLEVEIKKDWDGYEDNAVVYHARNGKSGQYEDLMSNELIEYIKRKWLKLCNKKKQLKRFF